MTTLAKKTKQTTNLITEVRPFKDEDLKAFLVMGQWMQECSDYSDCGFDKEKMIWMFANIRKNPDYFGVMAISALGEPVGCFIGSIQDFYFSTNKMAADLALVIYPEYRGNSKQTMEKMLAMFEGWAKERGAMMTVVATSSKAHGPKLEGFLNNQGYETVGFTTKKRI